MNSSNNRELYTSNAFLRSFKKLNNQVKNDVDEKANKLLIDPFNKKLNIKKLKGYNDSYRVVIINNFRMIYSFDESTILLLDIKHRKDIYKK